MNGWNKAILTELIFPFLRMIGYKNEEVKLFEVFVSCCNLSVLYGKQGKSTINWKIIQIIKFLSVVYLI
jgi:hypothetical protein